MPRRIKSMSAILSGNLVVELLEERWKKSWAKKWEAGNRPCTLTGGEIAWLLMAADDETIMEMKERCEPVAPGGVDLPVPGSGAPAAVRYFASAYTRSPDEVLSFMQWARKEAARIQQTKVFEARLRVQGVNAIARSTGKHWAAKDIEIQVGENNEDVTAPVDHAIRAERKRVSALKTRHKVE